MYIQMALASWSDLLRGWPNVYWRFIAVNVSPAELRARERDIMRLIEVAPLFF
jgi:hypothetical protein